MIISYHLIFVNEIHSNFTHCFQRLQCLKGHTVIQLSFWLTTLTTCPAQKSKLPSPTAKNSLLFISIFPLPSLKSQSTTAFCLLLRKSRLNPQGKDTPIPKANPTPAHKSEISEFDVNIKTAAHKAYAPNEAAKTFFDITRKYHIKGSIIIPKIKNHSKYPTSTFLSNNYFRYYLPKCLCKFNHRKIIAFLYLCCLNIPKGV